MSSVAFLLATRDPEILRAWWVLVPAGARVITLSDLGFRPAGATQHLGMVAVVDKAVAAEIPAAFANAPTIMVGERDGDVDDAVGLDSPRTRIFLSRQESLTRLGEFLPLFEEIAERGAAANILWEKKGAVATPPITASAGDSDNGDAWEFFAGAVEALGSREQLLAEFRRSARRALGTSHVVFFLRDGSEFRADRGLFSCSAHDPLIHYLSAQPVVLDGTIWPGNPNPVVELTMRQRMATWSVRLIVPLHDNGRLLGLIGFGVRDDGLPYETTERTRAVRIARLLSQMLGWSAQSGQIAVAPDRWQLGEKYLPGILLLAVDEAPPSTLPAAIAALIAEVRQLRITRKLVAGPGQPFRATAGIVAETQGVWVSWEDASAEIQEVVRRARAERLELLHDLALTLNHELGNSLVSLAALRHNPGAETNSPVLLAAIKRDIASLEAINRHLASIPTFSEVSAESVDLRALVCAVGRKCGVVVETDSEPVTLDVAPRLIDFGLESIIDSIAENRPGQGKRDLSISVRSSGSGAGFAAVLTIRCPGLSLEGVLPAPAPDAAPTHGRIGVFIAKEIIRLHGGTIEGGSGLNGPEISITIRAW